MIKRTFGGVLYVGQKIPSTQTNQWDRYANFGTEEYLSQYFGLSQTNLVWDRLNFPGMK